MISLIHRPRCPAAHCIHCRVHQKHNADGDEASAACAAAHASFSGGILADGIDLRDMNRKRKARMKILILYGAIGSMATVDSALFSSSAIRVIKMIVLSLLYISLNRALAKLRVWLKHSAHRPIPISKSP